MAIKFLFDNKLNYMAKKTKILIFLAAVFLTLALYLILTSESIQKNQVINQLTKDKNITQLEENYQAKSREIFKAYEQLIQADNFSPENIIEHKNRLLDLRVPAKYKELHLNLVWALTKMENYLNQKDAKEKTASLEMTNQLKADYSWLNN